MSEHQCSSCGKEYSNQEWNKLDRVQAVKDEDNPEGPHGHGYHSVCECGHEFWEDEWQLKTTVETDDREFRVSTTHLVLNHGHGNGDLWYETCVFWDAGSYILGRYETREEAREGHGDTVDALQNGDFEVQDSQAGTLTIGPDAGDDSR